MKFVKDNFMIQNFVLWGRSMGAATSLMYLSSKLRAKIMRFMKEKYKITNYEFLGNIFLIHLETKHIQGLILDSPLVTCKLM